MVTEPAIQWEKARGMIEVYPHAFTVSERSPVEKDENPDRDMLFCVSSREIGRIETHSSQQHICRRYSSMSLLSMELLWIHQRERKNWLRNWQDGSLIPWVQVISGLCPTHEVEKMGNVRHWRWKFRSPSTLKPNTCSYIMQKRIHTKSPRFSYDANDDLSL